MRLRWPRNTRRAWAGLGAFALLVGIGTVGLAVADDAPTVRRVDRVLTMPEEPGSERTVGIDTSYFVAESADGGAPRPAVLLGHGFGGSKDDTREQAEALAADGYAVLTWSARGFGASTGQIGLNDPDREVADVSRLVDWLGERAEVAQDGPGDPRVGIAGASYGGAIALLAAGHDDRVDAIAPAVTYWDLGEALFPNGVFKQLWAGILFTTGAAAPIGGELPAEAGVDPGCGRFTDELCALYQRVAVAGASDPEALALLAERSPAAVADRIDVPTLILQGQHDSLFPLDHADAMAEALRANGAPVRVEWLWAGHDGGISESGRTEERITAWFDRHLREDASADVGPPFRVTRITGFDTTNGDTLLAGASGDAYPGLDGEKTGTVELSGEPQTFVNPPGGAPAAVSTVPGLGGLGGFTGLGFLPAIDFPGQFARFDSPPLTEATRVTGSPTVRLRVSSDTDEAVLFGKLYDVAPDGGSESLPAQLVAPLRVEDLGPEGRVVTFRLPTVDYPFEAGHRMRLVVSSTDIGYASPAGTARYTVALDDLRLTLPTAPGVATAATPVPWWVWGLPLGALAVAVALVAPRVRRRAAVSHDPGLAGTPLAITGLTKRYARHSDRYAVRDLSFRVERGQVLGLLGPNGAGKTTTLRMLMGLITPDAGEITVFGHRVGPGSPVLSRVGAFVEGAGFLPHLSGRANLELYWRATGRPAADARLEEALEIADLGPALARPVRTYSQGMRQRLAIAQAMLGLPDLLILDEPTNGLDPPQIRAMREVMVRYAEGGRTVIVSSHLLAEVEQTCTHLVVMDGGRLVASGPVAEIVGTGDTVLVSTAEPMTDAWLATIRALPGVGDATDTESGVLVRLDGAGPETLVAALVAAGIPVSGVMPHRRLEDAFLTLIGGA
ncbi:ABC-2 type transport system ATP-binding protein [Streptomyces zhaozhouensis]|uniref:ABC-2 type transport system ATP-binding protein n=1 Tax=Streptomyces zhaozhouensis TaxID=1300267 RepID=A0A286DSW8_9ACTN|nr:alpha/beta fold hydrolase [Streptomyces zhaozhouensis]SOD61751.1 ABC-2 type transport system ATP-binding protein [Streptomyces zhaozhouensis]